MPAVWVDQVHILRLAMICTVLRNAEQLQIPCAVYTLSYVICKIRSGKQQNRLQVFSVGLKQHALINVSPYASL